MFTQKIIDSDAFLDMPLSAQALYFHLAMRADDDGFVNNPKKILRYISASEDDFKILFAKRFILGFESGVIVIKHWRMHNAIKSDRYHPTDYQEELALLSIKPNRAYTDKTYCPQLPESDTDRSTGGDNLDPERSADGTSDIGIGLDIGLDSDIGLGSDKEQKNNKGSKKKFEESSKPYLLAVFLGKRIQKRLPSTAVPQESTLQQWADAIDKCNRLDGHPWDEIKLVLKFSQEDPFWQQNILSGKKFRAKYMELLAKWTAQASAHHQRQGQAQGTSTADRLIDMAQRGVFDE